MKCSLRLKLQSLKHRLQQGGANDQQGVTLVLALMLGMVLLAGVSSLLARHLMSRRLSAKESYQQMAEGAANNGLNRILGQLNNPDPSQNRGFLFTLDNRENLNEPNNGFLWELLNTRQSPQFSEVCLDTSIGLPNHPQGKSAAFWPTTEVALASNNSINMREDGISKIETFYRLRGYSSPGTSGSSDSGEAKFIIEGIVRRKGASPNSYLARSRLERSLYIQSWVDISRSDDWAILAADHFELGPVQLNSPGQIVWHTSENMVSQILGQCKTANLVQRLGGSARNTRNLAARIWPVVNQKQPPTTIFKTTGVKDSVPGRTGEIRIWRIDDEYLSPPGCTWRVACQRGSNDNAYSRPSGIERLERWHYIQGRWQATTTIRLRTNDICSSQTGDCHVFLDRLNLRHSKLLIENDSRPVVLHLLGPAQGHSNTSGDQTASMSLSTNALICGVDKNSSSCNQRPERLIISTEATAAPDRCSAQHHRLNLAGNSLPAAWILMRQGTVALQADTQLQGMIWTHSFCSNNHRLSLNASTQTAGSSTLTQQAANLWDWGSKGFSGYGRRITRGIRGTGLDQFQRF